MPNHVISRCVLFFLLSIFFNLLWYFLNCYTSHCFRINWYQSRSRAQQFNLAVQSEIARKNIIKFEIPWFDGTNFALWKLKMHAVSVKDCCAVTILDKKPEGMIEKQFAEKDELALANLLLTLDDSMLFNINLGQSRKDCKLN